MDEPSELDIERGMAASPAAPIEAAQTSAKLPRHKFWGAGEPDCPADIKAANGELHTARCKVCGDGWRKSVDVCFGAPAAASSDELRAAAQAVVERWDSPLWKDLPHTGNYIARLRDALASAPPAAATVEVPAKGLPREGCNYLATELCNKCGHYHRLAAPTEGGEQPARKLWLWQNFVDGRPEFWAFDNPYPINLNDGDPQTLGEPVGYAIVKPSRPGRTDVSEDKVIAAIKRARPAVAAAGVPPMAKEFFAQGKHHSERAERYEDGWDHCRHEMLRMLASPAAPVGAPTDAALLEAALEHELIVLVTGDGKGEYYPCQHRSDGRCYILTYGSSFATRREALRAGLAVLGVQASPAKP